MSKFFPVAAALRDAGFVPLPRLWVRREDIPQIHEIANQYADQVNDIRGRVNADNDNLVTRKVSKDPDPKSDIQAAWEAYEKSKEI